MTYLLVCALCAGTSGQLAPQGGASDEPTTLHLEGGTLLPAQERDAPALALALAAPLPLAAHSGSDGHSGHDGGGSHMGPMDQRWR